MQAMEGVHRGGKRAMPALQKGKPLAEGNLYARYCAHCFFLFSSLQDSSAPGVNPPQSSFLAAAFMQDTR